MTVLHVGTKPHLDKSFPDCKYIFLDYTPYIGTNWGGLLLQVSHRITNAGTNLVVLDFDTVDMVNELEFDTLLINGAKILNISKPWTSKMITDARHILYFASEMAKGKRGCSKKLLAEKTKALVSGLIKEV